MLKKKEYIYIYRIYIYIYIYICDNFFFLAVQCGSDVSKSFLLISTYILNYLFVNLRPCCLYNSHRTFYVLACLKQMPRISNLSDLNFGIVDRVPSTTFIVRTPLIIMFNVYFGPRTRSWYVSFSFAFILFLVHFSHFNAAVVWTVSISLELLVPPILFSWYWFIQAL